MQCGVVYFEVQDTRKINGGINTFNRRSSNNLIPALVPEINGRLNSRLKLMNYYYCGLQRRTIKFRASQGSTD